MIMNVSVLYYTLKDYKNSMQRSLLKYLLFFYMILIVSNDLQLVIVE